MCNTTYPTTTATIDSIGQAGEDTIVSWVNGAPHHLRFIVQGGGSCGGCKIGSQYFYQFHSDDYQTVYDKLDAQQPVVLSVVESGNTGVFSAAGWI